MALSRLGDSEDCIELNQYCTHEPLLIPGVKDPEEPKNLVLQHRPIGGIVTL